MLQNVISIGCNPVHYYSLASYLIIELKGSDPFSSPLARQHARPSGRQKKPPCKRSRMPCKASRPPCKPARPSDTPRKPPSPKSSGSKRSCTIATAPRTPEKRFPVEAASGRDDRDREKTAGRPRLGASLVRLTPPPAREGRALAGTMIKARAVNRALRRPGMDAGTQCHGRSPSTSTPLPAQHWPCPALDSGIQAGIQAGMTDRAGNRDVRRPGMDAGTQCQGR